MPAWLPSIAYNVPRAGGYWSPVTSTLNWCEEDYYATPYAAEIVNSLTNAVFFYYGYLGVRNCLQQGHDAVFLASYLGYLVVGIGSFLFHATLKYPLQLLDELSMIYTTCIMCYATFSHNRTPAMKKALAVALTALSIGITLYYHYLQDPAFHQRVYALLTTIVVARQVYVMEYLLRPSLQPPKSVNVSVARLQRDRYTLITMWKMIFIGLTTFLGGFIIWSIDNIFCSTLRMWRHELGLPWGILLEGHGWWHLLTGTGAYFYIAWGIWLRRCLDGEQDSFEMSWPTIWSLPMLARKTPDMSSTPLKKTR